MQLADLKVEALNFSWQKLTSIVLLVVNIGTNLHKTAVQDEVVRQIEDEQHVEGRQTGDVTGDNLRHCAEDQLLTVVAFVELQEPENERRVGML